MTVRYYSEDRTLPMRALQIFTILVGCAHRRETLTYKLLANRLGYKGAGVLDKQLGLIMYWCDGNGLPPLTVLVVNSENGLPGGGLIASSDFHADRETVFNTNWYDIVPPTLDELKVYKGK